MACSPLSRTPLALRLPMLGAVLASVTMGQIRLALADEQGSAQTTVISSPPDGNAQPTADGAQPTADGDAVLERARLVVAVAERLFLAGQYPAALAEYTRAHEMLTGHPRQFWVLHNLAACNERMFRYDVAVALYEEYLQRAPAAEADRAEVNAVLHTLRSLLAVLEVDSSVASEVWLDDRRLGTAPGRWRVPAGHHIVEVRAAHYEAQRRELQLNAGQVESAHFQLLRLSTYAGPQPIYFWISVGLTGAATLAGISAGFLALDAHARGRDRASLYLDTQGDAQRTRRWALASDAGFGTAILFGATATVLYFVSDWSGSGQPGRTRRASSARRSFGVGFAADSGVRASLNGEF